MPQLMTLTVKGYQPMSGVRLARRSFDTAKRCFDFVFGLLAMIIYLPVFLIAVAIVKLASKGPAIYMQIRVGQDGKLFKMYKLRTMYHNAESGSGPVWASDKDPRVVPSCRWMRRTHIDELPQLINVLKGEMSLIGPRPERPEIIAQLQKIYPEMPKRLTVLPGITGLAQIRNGYDKTLASIRRKLDNDLEYINNRGWTTELLILAMTLTKLYDKSSH
jgi:lipopolysaccharide/colanic/teichoic acid biosynthesis glycosyltransferase